MTMPGSASGRTSNSEMVSRPKKRNRWTANAAAEPRRSASTVAASPALSESTSDVRTSGSCQATENQCVVKWRIGQLCTFERSKAKITIVAIGMKRNINTPTTQTASTILVARPSIYIASNPPKARAVSR